MMSGASNISKDKYTFKKLEVSNNYKQQTGDISFILEQAKLWRHVEKTAITPPPFIFKGDDNEDQMEKIYARDEKICECQNNAHKAIAKFGKMCTKIV